MKIAISMDGNTMEHENHETEINESIIDSNNIHFFRVDNSPGDKVLVWTNLSPLCLRQAVEPSRRVVPIYQC